MKNNSKILIVVGVLAVIAIGITFAYFISGVAFTGEGSKTNATAAELSRVVYDAGSSSINATDLVPGASASKNFKVTITPGGDGGTVTYAIKLNITENTFIYCDDTNYILETNACTKNTEELIYTLKDNDGNTIATGNLTAITGNILLATETKIVTVETEFNYTLEVKFKDTDADQNHNINKNFISSLKVEFA